MSAAAEWEDLLRPGETILWQGAPKPRADLLPLRVTLMLAFVASLGMLPILKHFDLRGDEALAAGALYLGGVFLLIGLPQLKKRASHNDRFYTLTNMRAFVGLTSSGVAVTANRISVRPKTRSLVEYDLKPGTRLTLDRGETLSIYFDTRATQPRAGFERLEEGDKVLALIEEIVAPEAPAAKTGLADEETL